VTAAYVSKVLVNHAGVVLQEVAQVGHEGQSWLEVRDEHLREYRLVFTANDDHSINVAAHAQWTDDHPGDLANFTSEDGLPDCRFEDTVTIADDGLLTVMARKRGASSVVMHSGFTLQLPVQYVPPVRCAIRTAWKMAATREGKRIAAELKARAEEIARLGLPADVSDAGLEAALDVERSQLVFELFEVFNGVEEIKTD